MSIDTFYARKGSFSASSSPVHLMRLLVRLGVDVCSSVVAYHSLSDGILVDPTSTLIFAPVAPQLIYAT